MKLYAGTSGFSYPEWKGTFYPEKIAVKNMLSYYAKKLSTVEINNTFYRMPQSSVIDGWISAVGDDFLFSVKASRHITHFKKLADTSELLSYLVRGLAQFGTHLGPVLLQCPPTLKASVPLLAQFLKDFFVATDKECRAGAEHLRRPRLAFEFRHSSWFDESVYSLLREHDVALVGGDLDDDNKNPPLLKTGRQLYLRLRKTHYEAGQIEEWAKKIKALDVDEAFVYFKHEELGPELASKLGSYFRWDLQ